MNRQRFEELVADVLDDIPEPFGSRLENVAVVIEDEPPASLLRDLGLHPRRDTLFGLYEGVPLSEREANYAMSLPDRITLFYRPLIRSCATPGALRREIRKTLIHEIAHFFGFDEEAVEEEGY